MGEIFDGSFSLCDLNSYHHIINKNRQNDKRRINSIGQYIRWINTISTCIPIQVNTSKQKLLSVQVRLGQWAGADELTAVQTVHVGQLPYPGFFERMRMRHGSLRFRLHSSRKKIR